MSKSYSGLRVFTSCSVMCFSEVSDELDAASCGVTVFGSGKTSVFGRRKANSFTLKTETIGFSENSRQIHYTA